jgi:hypothetical protein
MGIKLKITTYMAINYFYDKMLKLGLLLVMFLALRATMPTLFISSSMPMILYTIPAGIPADTTNCIHNGQTWVNPLGKVWDGTNWVNP